MSDEVVSLRDWKARQSEATDDEPEDDSPAPTSLAQKWFLNHGPLRGQVDKYGTLILEHESPIPPFVMRELARAIIVYFDGLTKDVAEMAGKRQYLCSWLEDGMQAKSLKPIRPIGMQVPLGATTLILAVMHGYHTLQLCTVRYFPDERRQASKKDSPGG